MDTPSNVVNLRRFRKQKARGEAEAKARESRAIHGQTKAERDKVDAQVRAARRLVDNHKITGPGDETS